MKVIVLNSCNLNSINEKQWNSFCEYLGPFLEAYTKFEANTAIVEISKDGMMATIRFHIKERESFQTVTAKFDKLMCKEWSYQNFDKKIKNIPPHNVTLSWQVFLTKVFGEEYKTELEDFYKKNKVSTGLIKNLIKNSENDFKF